MVICDQCIYHRPNSLSDERSNYDRCGYVRRTFVTSSSFSDLKYCSTVNKDGWCKYFLPKEPKEPKEPLEPKKSLLKRIKECLF